MPRSSLPERFSIQPTAAGGARCVRACDFNLSRFEVSTAPDPSFRVTPRARAGPSPDMALRRAARARRRVSRPPQRRPHWRSGALRMRVTSNCPKIPGASRPRRCRRERPRCELSGARTNVSTSSSSVAAPRGRMRRGRRDERFERGAGGGRRIPGAARAVEAPSSCTEECDIWKRRCFNSIRDSLNSCSKR